MVGRKRPHHLLRLPDYHQVLVYARGDLTLHGPPMHPNSFHARFRRLILVHACANQDKLASAVQLFRQVP